MKTQLHVSLSLPTHIYTMLTSITKCHTTTPSYLWPYSVRRVQSPCLPHLSVPYPTLHIRTTFSPLYPVLHSGILRSVVKRNTEELAGDHSEDSNIDKKVQLIMSTATLTKVSIHRDRQVSQEKTMCWLFSIGSIEPLRKFSAATSCHCFFIDIS
jgi:hypothetical protein